MKKQFLLSVIITFTFLSLGFALLHFELIGYGLSFFVFLPFLLGYILGKSFIRMISFAGLVFSFVVFFILLLAGHLEGMVCILMALPLLILAIAVGASVNYLINGNKKKDHPEDLIHNSLLPFIVFVCLGFAEKQLTKNYKEVISVKTELIVPYTTMQVYDAIKSVDTLIAEKPFLMRLDLPVPLKCVLQKEEPGGLRICYFSGGTITERITDLEKGKTLRMDVIDYNLTGRSWLGFKEAIYYFGEAGAGKSKITRITTYTSVLMPRLYWEPLEKIGIRQEHEYVFDNLKRDLLRKHGN